MTQAKVKYPAIFSPDENYRKPALRAMTRTFSLDTDYKNDLIFVYDTKGRYRLTVWNPPYY